MLRLCKLCGAELEKKAKFCTQCGKPATPKNPARICPNPECQNYKQRKAFKVYDKFCDLCGTEIVSSENID